jgi:hypothetical protein
MSTSDRPEGYAGRLSEWLPALWRERDGHGDLHRLLAAYGEMLDAFRATLDQRLSDNFPDHDPEGRHCQDWLLPYFAQLLDVRLVSPDVAGRRRELRDAVAWRQRKGTRVSVEAIAEAVGQFEVEVQEGWKRVAVTPRIERPLLPEAVFGEPAIDALAGAAALARHPGLPAATVDLRYCSRAVQCDPANPAAHATRFLGERLSWRQINRHGVPCAPHPATAPADRAPTGPHSYLDVSRRTVDLRTPDGQRGHAHPRRILLYMPPPEGFFAIDRRSVAWARLEARIRELAAIDVTTWPEDRTQSEPVAGGDGLEISLARGKWNGQVLPRITLRAAGDTPVRVSGVALLEQAAVYCFENLWFDNRLQVEDGCVILSSCALRHLKVFTAARQAPVVEARACLFRKLEAARGLVRLEYATVLSTLLAERLEASDCIITCALRKDAADADVPGAGCLRFSRLDYIPQEPDPEDPAFDNDPRWLSQNRRSLLRCFSGTCTTTPPLFWTTELGQPGCGVLRSECASAIRSGAEDGGEMGAFHDRRYVLRQRAVIEKLQDFLPVGIEPVLIADRNLACPPPKAKKP